MIKKLLLLALIVCLFLGILSPSLVQAQDELSIVDSSVQLEFPN